METRTFAPRLAQACLACRNKHIKCDGHRPNCNRCAAEGRSCEWARSRRGGFTRAELAARRAARDAGKLERTSDRRPGSENHGLPALSRHPTDDGESIPLHQADSSPSSGTLTDYSPFGLGPLVGLYYKHFHRFHPFMLPERHMLVELSDPRKREELAPLVACMGFVGSLYCKLGHQPALQEAVLGTIWERHDAQPSPVLAQSQLLASIAMYWHGDRDAARKAIDKAIGVALETGMFRREFALENSGGDVVRAESWRRTWWQVYIVDAWYAAIRKLPTFRMRDVEATVELPCEEDEYESGMIPTPKTLEDFDAREFSPGNHVFSSFAYLIGATRGIASAITSVPTSTADLSSRRLLESVDAIVEGWMLLLPECKREVLSSTGQVDELMFQAHMSVYASTIGLHRPMSSLWFNPLEAISDCSMPTPDAVPPQAPLNIHTTRCMKAIEGQIRLMALPSRPFCHTPFTICMVTTGTITLLSACKYLHAGAQLALSRHQIRLSIGCLKAMAEVWPQGARTLDEVQTIAREVLGLVGKSGDGGGGSSSSSSNISISSRAVPRGVGDGPAGDGIGVLDGALFGDLTGLLEMGGGVEGNALWFSGLVSPGR